MHSCEEVQRGAGLSGDWGVVTVPHSQQRLLEMHHTHPCMKMAEVQESPCQSSLHQSSSIDSSQSIMVLWCANGSDSWLMHSSLSVSCLLVDANQRGLSGPVTGFHHSCTYSRGCSSSAKARRRGSLESTPCGIGIQHSPNSPSGSSEDRRLSWCFPGSP